MSGIPVANAWRSFTRIVRPNPFRGVISTTIGMESASILYAMQGLGLYSAWWLPEQSEREVRIPLPPLVAKILPWEDDMVHPDS